MDQLKELQLFARVVERESFTAVARETGLSQPSVSRQIASLEERLKARLLLRSTRRVRPTEAGLLLYERAKRALEELAEAEAEVARTASGYEGTLRVAASLAYGSRFIVPAARTFLARFPKVRFELIVNDRYVDLIEEGVDVAVRLGELEDSAFKARRLGREELVLVASSRYVRTKGRPHALDELEAHDAVVLVRRGAPMRWTFRTAAGERHVTLKGPLHVDSVVGALAAAREGIGIAILPSYLVDEDLKARTLVRLLPSEELVGLPVHAVYPAARRLSAKVQSFIEHLASAIGSSDAP